MVGGHATVGRLSNNVFWTFQATRKIFEKSRWTVTRQWLKVTRPSADCQTTFLNVSSKWEIFWKKSLNGHATVVGGHATVGRLSKNDFPTFQAIRKNFEKSHWTVTRQWSEVTRPSADCETTFFRRFEQLGNFLKKVTERSRDSGRRSRDRRPTVKERFSNVSSNKEKFWKKVAERSRDSGWRSRDRRPTVKQRFWTFQAFGKNFEKSHWTVTRQWSEVTRPSADCQRTIFRRFKQFGKILKKVAERSRDSGRRSRDHWPTVKQRFFDVSSNSEKVWKKSLIGHATVVGSHATVGRLSNKVFWTFQANGRIFEKSRWTVTRQWLKVTRPSADCQTTFLDVSSKWEIFWKKSLNGHATVVGGHATVGRLSKNDFPTFQAIWKNFEKSHWTVTRQWSEITRPSADCQTTFSDVPSN